MYVIDILSNSKLTCLLTYYHTNPVRFVSTETVIAVLEFDSRFPIAEFTRQLNRANV